MTTYELTQYYANLLILQYLGSLRAYATVQQTVTPVIMPQVSVQTITFPAVPASGVFTLSYNGNSTANINWNDTFTTIQGKLQAVTGLGSVTVLGSISAGLLTVTFTGVTPPALPLVLVTNTLLTSGSASVVPVILETDETLPLAVQDAFNLSGSNPAVGVQLDIIGKYAGVSRNGTGLQGQPITLNDADFLTLILFAIITNNAGSSLQTIQELLNAFFPNEVLVFDYQNMRMSYLISSTIGSQNLIQLFVTEKLLPKPMAVALSVAVAPIITSFFGFRTYDLAPVNAKPFNTYDVYNMTWSWLTYADGVGT